MENLRCDRLWRGKASRTYSKLQLLYERLRQGEVQIIVGAQHVVPLPVYFIYLKYAVRF
ncbi:hypothetical protein [Nostoc sp.]|uniref:hypothetical protein n=1 Tax=Nostoc sp. TaxID=1180 RepID=UPI002FF77625